MRAIIIAVVVFALSQAGIATADPVPLRESAERAAKETALQAPASSVELQQQSEPRRRRSIRRTVGGIKSSWVPERPCTSWGWPHPKT